jgi:hypothetical protein
VYRRDEGDARFDCTGVDAKCNACIARCNERRRPTRESRRLKRGTAAAAALVVQTRSIAFDEAILLLICWVILVWLIVGA